MGQCQQPFSVDLRPRSSIFIHSGESLFHLSNGFQSYVLIRLKFTSYQALDGVDSLIPARSKRCLIPGFLQLAPCCLSHIVARLYHLLCGMDHRFQLAARQLP